VRIHACVAAGLVAGFLAIGPVAVAQEQRSTGQNPANTAATSDNAAAQGKDAPINDASRRDARITEGTGAAGAGSTPFRDTGSGRTSPSGTNEVK